MSQRSPAAPRAPPAPSQPCCSQGNSTECCAMKRCPKAPPLLPTDGTGTSMGRAAPSSYLCWLWTCALGRTGCSPCSGLWGNWCHWLWLSLLLPLSQGPGSRGEQPGCPHPSMLVGWVCSSPAPVPDKSLQLCSSHPARGSSQAPSCLGPSWLNQHNFLLSYDQSLIIAEE